MSLTQYSRYIFLFLLVSRQVLLLTNPSLHDTSRSPYRPPGNKRSGSLPLHLRPCILFPRSSSRNNHPRLVRLPQRCRPLLLIPRHRSRFRRRPRHCFCSRAKESCAPPKSRSTHLWTECRECSFLVHEPREMLSRATTCRCGRGRKRWRNGED